MLKLGERWQYSKIKTRNISYDDQDLKYMPHEYQKKKELSFAVVGIVIVEPWFYKMYNKQLTSKKIY
jgi:hypothetical protein